MHESHRPAPPLKYLEPGKCLVVSQVCAFPDGRWIWRSRWWDACCLCCAVLYATPLFPPSLSFNAPSAFWLICHLCHPTRTRFAPWSDKNKHPGWEQAKASLLPFAHLDTTNVACCGSVFSLFLLSFSSSTLLAAAAVCPPSTFFSFLHARRRVARFGVASVAVRTTLRQPLVFVCTSHPLPSP